METICYNLERQEQVCKRADGLSALEKARKKELDLILLDVMLQVGRS